MTDSGRFNSAIENELATKGFHILTSSKLRAQEIIRTYFLNALSTLKKNSVRLNDTLILKSREKYPQNRILFCPYGLGTYELIDRFNKGKLPGVKYLLDPDIETREEAKREKEQLLNDELGHPGELVAKTGALLWLQTLYEYDLSSLKAQRIKVLPEIDLNEIAATVSKEIEPLNAAYKGK